MSCSCDARRCKRSRKRRSTKKKSLNRPKRSRKRRSHRRYKRSGKYKKWKCQRKNKFRAGNRGTAARGPDYVKTLRSLVFFPRQQAMLSDCEQKLNLLSKAVYIIIRARMVQKNVTDVSGVLTNGEQVKLRQLNLTGDCLRNLYLLVHLFRTMLVNHWRMINARDKGFDLADIAGIRSAYNDRNIQPEWSIFYHMLTPRLSLQEFLQSLSIIHDSINYTRFLAFISQALNTGVNI